MIKIILRRLLIGLFVMWGAASLIFVIVRVAPGDPATVMLGPDADPEQIARLHETLGLDRPMFAQYLSFLGDAVRLDFGDSHRLGRPATDAVFDRLPATIELTLAATIALQSFPTFWVGIMLILVFALGLRLLPSAGVGTPQHMILPAVTLALPLTAIVARLTRSSVAETMREPYVQTARSKGLAEPQVLLGHALRNSLIPVVTVVGLQMGPVPPALPDRPGPLPGGRPARPRGGAGPVQRLPLRRGGAVRVSLLEIRDLRVTFGRRRDPFVAVDGVGLDVGAEETVGLVGESGPGKTTVARCVAGLQRPDSGTVTFEGRPLERAGRRPAELRRAVQMVFQDPRSSLNPRMSVAAIIEVLGSPRHEYTQALLDAALDLDDAAPEVAS